MSTIAARGPSRAQFPKVQCGSIHDVRSIHWQGESFNANLAVKSDGELEIRFVTCSSSLKYRMVHLMK